MSRTPLSAPSLILAAGLAAALGACSDPGPGPSGPVPDAPGAAFYEPAAVCLGGSAAGDTLFVYHLGGENDLVVHARRVPEGSTGLDREVVVEPETGAAVVWTWEPSGPYPVLDTLVLETNDPDRPELTVPFRREDPAAAPADRIPPPPVLGSPPDGIVVSYPDTVADLWWSRVQNCGPSVVEYVVQISERAHFPPPVTELTVPSPRAQIVFAGDGADRGTTVYWRIRSRLTGGATSAATLPRSIVHD